MPVNVTLAKWINIHTSDQVTAASLGYVETNTYPLKGKNTEFVRNYVHR